jgi:hypothetical protein
MVEYERGKVPSSSAEEEAIMLAHAHEEPDISDMPEWTNEDWAQAIRPYMDLLHVETDVLVWLNKHQYGYANSILRDAMMRERQVHT